MIKKAVIPAAGFGTRFLPLTKAQPKEMLPIVDTPTIHFVVEEAVQAGIRDILIITGRGKQAIENYFDRAFELEANLAEKGREEQLLQVRKLSTLANIHFIRQTELNGLGDAIRYARWHVGNEPFVVLLGDVLVESSIPCTRQLIDVYNRVQAPVIAVEEVPMEKVGRYGIIGGKEIEPRTYKVDVMVEKPLPSEAPSNLAVAARYVLTPDIFDAIDATARGAGGEIQLTDAIKLLIENRPVYAHKFEGQRHDMGNRLDYMKTVLRYGVKREDIGPELRDFLRDFVKTLD
jgi:UTP--glucose-1-phosphate uridylyltransferase